MVRPTPAAIATLTPLGGEGVSVTGGFWGERLTTNRERTIPHGFEQLERAGTLENLRLAAGAQGPYRALGGDVRVGPSRSSTRTSTSGSRPSAGSWAAPPTRSWRAPPTRRSRSSPPPSGRTATSTATSRWSAPGEPYRDLAWGHELYCVGHLIQAAVAWHRALGDDRLLGIAIRAVGSIDAGASGRRRSTAIDGHPEIEMALVELFRVTGERRHLDLAARMIELRGHGLLGDGRFGPAYWQDHAPVRDAPTVAGHAVRQLYLDCGAVDVAVETGDQGLLDAVIRRWRDMVATRSYLTGGLGSRHRDEAFGDPFELPPDRAYAETCAAIASVMLAWRLLLATGDPDCADVIERTTYNGVLPGVSFDGTRFFYVNPLQRRTHRSADQTRRRRARAVVSLRLLPTEPHAAPELVAAVPCHHRRRRHPDPPVRHSGDLVRTSRPAGSASTMRDRLPVGRR